ncbi:hypothetical protein CC86DRAFT_292877, partial [Ophiobolus disseminans]
IPFTGNRRPNSLEYNGQGPERLYSHGMGGSDQFYGRHFEDEGRDDGYSHNMAEGPRGRVAPYSLAVARAYMKKDKETNRRYN